MSYIFAIFYNLGLFILIGWSIWLTKSLIPLLGLCFILHPKTYFNNKKDDKNDENE